MPRNDFFRISHLYIFLLQAECGWVGREVVGDIYPLPMPIPMLIESSTLTIPSNKPTKYGN